MKINSNKLWNKRQSRKMDLSREIKINGGIQTLGIDR